MRKTWFLMASIVGVLLIAGIAKSQVAPMFEELRVTVPFQFYAGDTPMTAGGYRIARDEIWDPQVLTLARTDGTKTIFMMVHLKDLGAPAKWSGVSFNKYGNEYFFAGIQIAGFDHGQELSRSRTEARAATGELSTRVYLPAVLK